MIRPALLAAFLAWPAAALATDYYVGPGGTDTIFITYSSYITIDGLRSFNANRAALRIDNSDHVTVRSCVFGNNATWGLFTDFSDYVTLEGNECHGSAAEHGICHSNSGDPPRHPRQPAP